MKAVKVLIVGFFIFEGSITKAQLKVGDQPTILNKAVSIDAQGSSSKQGLWLPRVIDTSISGIGALNPPNGLVIYHTPISGASNNKLLVRSNDSWINYLTTALTTITVGTQSVSGPNISFPTGTAGSDFNITANSSANTVTFNLPDASATTRGAVTTAGQTFSGAKTFSNGVTVNNGASINGGTVANGGLSVTGSTAAASSLTLGLTSATTPAASTDKYLSVNTSGIVTLNAINAVNNITAAGQTNTGNVTFNTATTGTDFNITSSANNINFNLPDASATARGAVTITAQTLGGAKTFANGVTVNNGAIVNNGTTLNNGAIANGGLTVSGAMAEVSNLTLGITSATTPAAAVNSYLSVNNLGQVTLNNASVANTPVTQATATATATTISTTYVIVNNDMTVTPGAGDYLVFFTASAINSNNGKGAYFSIFKNGADITSSTVLIETAGGAASSVATNAYITNLLAGQTIDVRWKATANTETIYQRTLITQRVK